MTAFSLPSFLAASSVANFCLLLVGIRDPVMNRSRTGEFLDFEKTFEHNLHDLRDALINDSEEFF